MDIYISSRLHRKIHQKKRSICPRPDCKKEVESTVDDTPGSQNINELMDISPTLFNDSLLFSSPPKKRVCEPTSKLFSKKVKMPVSKENSPTLQKTNQRIGNRRSSENFTD